MRIHVFATGSMSCSVVLGTDDGKSKRTTGATCNSTVEMAWSGGAALNRTPSGWTKRLEDGG